MDELISASDGWAEDAHALAQPAYALLNVPVGADARMEVQISKAYVQTESAIAQNQLVSAAIRLRATVDTVLTWLPPS